MQLFFGIPPLSFASKPSTIPGLFPVDLPLIVFVFGIPRQNLLHFFGSKIQFKRKPSGAGSIVVNYKNDEDMNRILDLIEEKG